MRKYLLISSFIWTVGATGTMFAQPAFDVHFDGDEVNMPPQVTAHPDSDGTFTKPSFVASKDDYGIVVQDYHQEIPGKAVLLSGTSSLDFIAPKTAFAEGEDFSLKFDLFYDEALTDRKKYGLKVNFYNEDISYAGYQASVVFVPFGIRVLSGKTDETIKYDWPAGSLLRMRINVSYSKEKLEIFINDDFEAAVPLDAISPKGVRAFQFTGGADNSHYIAAIANIKAGASAD